MLGRPHSRCARSVAAADHLRRRAGTREITLADGDAAFATVRALRNPVGLFAVVQDRDDALASWRSTTALTVTLSATTGFVVLILGFAFHWQATRAREADLIHDTVRGRIDTALNRGRCGCGIGTWRAAACSGRIRCTTCSACRRRTICSPSARSMRWCITTTSISTSWRRQLADAKVQSIDHAFRMRHADGRWLWLRARCELARQDGEAGPASDRHRRRHHRTEKPGRAHRRGRPAAARRHRDHSGSLRVVGRRQPSGAVQFEFPGTASSAG